MSTLWTPGGEHEPASDEPASTPADVDAADLGAGPGDAVDPEVAAQLRQLREQLAATPVADIVANHAVGLWQLAIIHLAPEGEAEPDLAEAGLAIDAAAALIEGLEGRLGAHEDALRDALAQLRLAFVQVSQGGEPA